MSVFFTTQHNTDTGTATQCGCDLDNSALVYHQFIPYVVMNFDLLVLTILVLNIYLYHEKKLKMKTIPLCTVTLKAWPCKLIILWLFSVDQKSVAYSEFCFWDHFSFV